MDYLTKLEAKQYAKQRNAFVNAAGICCKVFKEIGTCRKDHRCTGVRNDMDITWLNEIGLDTETGISYTGGNDKYVSFIEDFMYDEAADIIREIEDP